MVRLKGGDPSIFARTTEEIAAYEAAGIDYEVVPGVTAALAASTYAGYRSRIATTRRASRL